MSILAQDFVLRFPEFQSLTQDHIELILDEAKTEIDETVWGNKYRAGVLFLTADKLALSPMGEPARLAPGDGMTTYLQEFERLRKIISAGFLVA